MKLFRLLPLGFLFVLLACEPVATFEKPQPDNVKDLAGFPGKVTGIYQSRDGQSRVIISKTRVIRISDFDFKYHLHQIDSATELRGNLLIDLATGETREILLDGDSIIEHHHSQDTIFDLASGNVLKKFRGNYFLNVNYGKQRWEVKSLFFHNGQLALQEISTKESLEKLRKITDTQTDSLRHFNPTKRQFKQFVKGRGFSGEELFFRVK